MYTTFGEATGGETACSNPTRASSSMVSSDFTHAGQAGLQVLILLLLGLGLSLGTVSR